MQLSTEQLNAAIAKHAGTFVEAAPGSGKTAVAAERFGVYRFGSLLNRPVLCLSFTRSATGELRERIRQRWGSAAISWPHEVLTFDAFHRAILEFLLRAKLLMWPGGHVEIRIHDTWRGHDGAWRIPAGSWLRVPFVRNGTVLTRAVRASEETFGFSRKQPFEDVMGKGFATHAEVRRVLQGALADPAIHETVVKYIKRRCGALIVDEFFDADETDLAVVNLACVAGVSVTAIGDPWQAIYEFRGARPDLAFECLSRNSFVRLPLTKSYRFESDGMRAYVDALRSGSGVSLLAVDPRSIDVVLANSWAPLWGAPSHVIPLSFGSIEKLSHALLTVLLDSITQSQLSLRAVYVAEAADMLGIGGEALAAQRQSALLSVVSALGDDRSYTVDEVFDLLRATVKDLGSIRRTRRLTQGSSQERTRLTSLRKRLREPGRKVAGLTVHQAKGREWRAVGVRLRDAQYASLRQGLRVDLKEDRLAYVALTRARSVVGWI